MPYSLSEIKTRSSELFKISVPLIVEQLFITFMGMVSTFLVSNVGEYAVSAVGIVDSISNLIIALFAALTTGGTIVVAQYIGRHEVKKAKTAAGQAIWLSLAFSLLVCLLLTIFCDFIIHSLFADADSDVMQAAVRFMFIVNFSYPILAVTQTIFGILRGSGDTGTPMAISLIMNALNFLLGFSLIRGINIRFIHTPAFGVEGAAVALVLARTVGMALAGLFLVFKARGVKLNSIAYFKPDFRMQKTILGLGVPTSVESSLFQLGKLLTQIFIVSFSTAAIAANSIAGSIAGFINVPGSAFSIGVMILIGQRIGRGEVEDVKRTTLFAVLSGMVLLGVLCLFFFIFGDFIVALYNPSPKAAGYIKVLLNLLYITTPLFWPISFVTPSALRAAGDVKYTMIAAVASMWLFRIVLGYVFGIVMGMGVVGIWLGMFFDWVVRGLLFYIRLLSGRWQGKGVKD